MRRVALVFLVAACGGKPPPQQQTIGHQVASSGAASCADVGVILRGHVSTGEAAGKVREAAIANQCEMDHWSPEVVSCVTSSKKPEGCIAQLSEKQRLGYSAQLEKWSEQYGGAEYGGEDYGGNDINDGAPEIACADAAGAAVLYSPMPVKLGEQDTGWDRSLRVSALSELCDNDSWELDVRNCLDPMAGTDNSKCLGALPTDARDHVTARLSAIDTLAGKLDAARKKKPDCKKVVAAHYADSAWKGKLDHIKGKDRTKMITESRTRMTKSCSADKWDDTLRACIVVGGGDDCFAAVGKGRKQWGFPASGVLIATGIPECDAWGAEVAKLATCDKFPESSRQAVQEAYEQATQLWLNTPADQKASVVAACQQVTDAIKQARVSMGCP
jgi:hypothetical protein